MTIALIVTVLFLGGAINMWLWANKEIVMRQKGYNASRIEAGESRDDYTLMWPVHKSTINPKYQSLNYEQYAPADLAEERVVLDAPKIMGN